MRMRVGLILSLFFTSIHLVAGETVEAEALAARRIISFYQDKNYSVAAGQIDLFLKTYPKSEYADQMRLLEGLILQSTGDHNSAIKKFNQVTSEEQKKAAHHAKLVSYRALGLKERIVDEGDRSISPLIISEALYELGRYDEAEKLLIDRNEIDAKFLIGKVLHAKGEFHLASDLFMELSKYEPRKNEALLLAAMAQAKFLPGLALKTLEGIPSGEGILFRAKLLIDMGRGDEVIASYTEFEKKIDPALAGRLRYFLARAYYGKRDFTKAAEILQPIIANLQDYPVEGKGALLTLIAAADAMERYDQLEEWSLMFHENYFNDSERGQVLYLQANGASKQGNFQLAIDRINELLEKYPKFPASDAAGYQKILLLSAMERFNEAKNEISLFSNRFPKSSMESQAKKLLPQILLRQFNTLAANDPARDRVINELDHAVNQSASSTIYSAKEKFRFTMALAHMQKGAGRYPDAIGLVQNVIGNLNDSADLIEAHELLAACYLEGKPDYPSFIYHTDQLLTLSSDSKKICRYQYNLFSAYIQFAKEVEGSSEEEKERYFTKAADSLDLVVASGEIQIPVEQLLWLGNWHESHIAKEACELLYNPLSDEAEIAHAEKGVRALAKAIGVEGEKALEIDAKSIYKEVEIIKLAQMLGWLKRYKQELALLEKLTLVQKENGSWGWKHYPLAMYSLGQTYHILGRISDALNSYQQIHESKQVDPAIAAATSLQIARIQFSLVSPENRVLENQDITKILANLKDLMTRKSLVQEPIHLEAGFAYAQIAAVLDKQSPQKRYLEELRGLKAQFAHKTDLWAKDYHRARTLHPEKDAIYQAYMMLADAQINYMQIHLKGEKEAQNDVRYEAAKTIFKTLLEGKYALTNYLVDEAKRGLEAMDKDQAIALPEVAPCKSMAVQERGA